jgi:hypothetical protein
MAFGFPQINPYQQYPAVQPGQARAVEVIPVDNEEQISSWQIPFGSTVEFVARDDSFVIFKSVEMNGQTTITAYDRRAAAPPATEFVRRDEVAAMIAAALEAKNGTV